MTTQTILIIEDNEQNLYLMRFLLEKNGFSIIDARSGEEGLAIAARSKADLILLDIQLPDIDGYLVAQRLRERESLRNTPVIVVTSYAMVGDREKALAAGATGYIEKPINPDTFVQQLRAHLPVAQEVVP